MTFQDDHGLLAQPLFGQKHWNFTQLSKPITIKMMEHGY